VTHGIRDVFTLVRYLPDGSRDPNFGTNGFARKGFARTAGVGGMALQPDGKIVVAGTKDHRADSSTATVVRFLPDGSLDTGFGDDGKAFATAGPNSTANKVALDSEGRIVIVGSVHDSLDHIRAALWRFDADGAEDRSFGSGGVAQLAQDSLGYDVAVDAQDRIVISGNAHVNFQSVFLAARFDANGHLDRTFGSGNGYVTTSFGSEAAALSVSLQPDSGIVLGGYGDAPNGFRGFALARYLEDGTLDGTFGHGGTVVTSFTRDGIVFDTLVQPDGAIVAVGAAQPKFMGVARYLANGRLDHSFSDNGRLEEHAGSNASGVALQADGKLVATAVPGGRGDFMVIRYLGS
jgi:uncharacterized delta-60 repeat protein